MTEYRCEKCAHTWFSRLPYVPKTCPACKRYGTVKVK